LFTLIAMKKTPTPMPRTRSADHRGVAAAVADAVAGKVVVALAMMVWQYISRSVTGYLKEFRHGVDAFAA
jgi:hypothetical protein